MARTYFGTDGVRGIVGEKGLLLSRGWRKANQIQIDAPQECRFVRWSNGSNATLLLFGIDEPVDRV